MTVCRFAVAALLIVCVTVQCSARTEEEIAQDSDDALVALRGRLQSLRPLLDAYEEATQAVVTYLNSNFEDDGDETPSSDLQYFTDLADEASAGGYTDLAAHLQRIKDVVEQVIDDRAALHKVKFQQQVNKTVQLRDVEVHRQLEHLTGRITSVCQQHVENQADDAASAGSSGKSPKRGRISRSRPEEYIEEDGVCYYLSSAEYSWSDAQDECQDKGLDLASVPDVAAKRRLTRMRDYRNNEVFWLSGRWQSEPEPEGQFVWTALDDEPVAERRIWADDEPSADHSNADGAVSFRVRNGDATVAADDAGEDHLALCQQYARVYRTGGN